VAIPDLSHLHPFGCPASVLDQALQSRNKTDNLLARSRMGVYLGLPPNHARKVHMILSMQNGHIMPQFHVSFDDMFKTIKDMANMPLYKWQAHTGLVTCETLDEMGNPHYNMTINSFVSYHEGESLQNDFTRAALEAAVQVIQGMDEDDHIPPVEEEVHHNEPIKVQAKTEWQIYTNQSAMGIYGVFNPH